jgi:subtilisin family serine protease
VIRPLAVPAALVVGLLLTAPSALAGGEQPVGAPPTPDVALSKDRVIVQWAPGADRGDRVEARAEADVSFDRTLGDSDFQTVDVDPGQSIGAALAELEGDPAVLVAEPDGWSVPQAVPNDPHFDQLWGLRNLGGAVGVQGFSNPLAGADIDVLGAWVRTVGTPSTVVAVLDSGYRFNHPDLGPVAWTNSDETDGDGDDDDSNGFVDDHRGYDFVGSSSDSPTSDKDPTDDNLLSGGHGVHVAGTVGAKGNDGVGITGVAQNARIMPLRVCGHSPTTGDARCPLSSQIAAINYAGANGARAANMSLGGTSFSQTVVNAIAANPQTLFVISAGNDGQNNELTHHYPCDYRPTVDALPPVVGAIDNIVCVAATNQADGLAGFSDYGAVSVDLGAPGTETLSAYPATDRYSETFETNDFASKWTATGVNGGFARTNEAPLTSFGMSDTPGAPPTANTVRQATSAGISIPAGLGSCSFIQTRSLSVGAGNQFTYAVLLNDSVVFQSAAVTTSGTISTVPIPALNAGGSVKIRETYTVGSSPLSTNGVWLDNLRLRCFESPSSTAATFDYLQGTSMAAPHVTGAAALLFSQRPSGTVTEIRNALLATTDPVPALAGKTVTGGRLNVSDAIDSFDPVAPTAPQLTVSPAGPANDNNPRVTGSVEELSTVDLYKNGSCSGAPAVTGTAAQLAAPGISVAVADNSTTTFSATATDTADNESSCSAAVSYSEVTPPPDLEAPDPPQLTVSPAGPANDNNPRVTGSAEALSTVTLYRNSSCAGAPAATASAAQLAAPGISVAVADNTTTTVSATATDTADNESDCSTPVSYTESTPPPVVDNPIVTPGPVVTGPILTSGPIVPVTPCRVPKLAKLSLAKATAALKKANCALGRVTKPKKKKGQTKLPPLVVKSSKPKAGTELTAGAKIAVTLGPKPKPKKR